MTLMIKNFFTIPYYGSERTIEAAVAELRQVMTSLLEYSYEIVMVSNSSPDNVYKVIQEL